MNHQERKVIFGAWDIHMNGDRTLILCEGWEIKKGRRNNGYAQSVERRASQVSRRAGKRALYIQDYALGRTLGRRRRRPYKDQRF